MKILIVEDDENSSLLLTTALEGMGYEAVSAESGESALRMMYRSPPDLVISDVMMPGMDGFELCRIIKTDPQLSHIPLVFYTATFTEPEDRELALTLGASRFIVKPIDIGEFLQIVTTILEEHKQNRLPIPRPSSTDFSRLHDVHKQRLTLKLDEKVRQLEQKTKMLRLSEARYRSLLNDVLDNSAVAIVILDKDFNVVWANRSFERFFHVRRDQVIGRDFRKTIDTLFTDVCSFRCKLLSIYREGRPGKRMICHLEKGHGKGGRWLEYHSQPIHTGLYRGGRVEHFSDITEIKQAEERLRVLSQAVEQSPASVIIADTEGSIRYVNPRFSRITGYGAEEAVHRNLVETLASHAPPDTRAEIEAALANGTEWRGELPSQRKNGEEFWEYVAVSPIRDNDGSISHFLAICEDVTVRKVYEERLFNQANFDSLTRLPNRVLAFDRLTQAIARAHRNGRTVAVMFIDLDNFKSVNDTLGHAAGDQLLIEAAKRLRLATREEDTVARLSGDEFLVILPDLATVHDSKVVAHKILSGFSAPFQLEGRELFFTVSIGISTYPDDSDNPHILLQHADAAMYRAKASGRNTYCYFTPDINRQAVHRLELESHLRQALEREEFVIQYQPIIDVTEQRMIGAEALLSWHNPVLGQVPPEQFIPVAEETGLIVPLGEWVMETACHQAKAWQEQLQSPFRIAINVSSRQFRERNFVRMVRRALDASRLTASDLELEITENLLLKESSEASGILNELNQMQISLAIDDFGTGYSALSYLKHFPFNSLKIDRTFVRDITTDKEDAALTRAIIVMAQSLGLKVTGEGVETRQQLRFLHDEGCNQVQGYYFCKPVPARRFSRLLQEQGTIDWFSPDTGASSTTH